MIIAIASLKGGTAKTTTAVAITMHLRARGRRALLVDTDPQATASRWMGAPASDLFGEWWCGTLGRVPLERAVVGDVIPASLLLNHVPLALAGEMSPERILRAGLRPLSRGYEWIVIDTPPGESIYTRSALHAADRVICPVIPGQVDGLERLLERLRRWKRGRLELAGLGGVILAMADHTRASAQTWEALERHFPGELLRPPVPATTRVREAWMDRKPLGGSRGGAATEAYGQITNEIERRARAWRKRKRG